MEEVEHLNEKQEVLATPMGKMRRQKVAPEDFEREIFEELKELEEQKTQEALELVKRKPKLVKWEGAQERARMLQGMDLSRAASHFSRALVLCPGPRADRWILKGRWATGQIGQRLRKMTPCLKERVPKSKVRKRKVKRKTTCGRLLQSAMKKQRTCAS